MTRRAEQVSSVIQRAVQQVLSGGLSDPRIAGLITVTSVNVSPDLATAVISVSVLPEEKQDLTLHGLRAASTFIRREAGEIIDSRKLPEFVFKLDKALKKQAEVLGALALLALEEKREIGGARPETPTEPETPTNEEDAG